MGVHKKPLANRTADAGFEIEALLWKSCLNGRYGKPLRLAGLWVRGRGGGEINSPSRATNILAWRLSHGQLFHSVRFPHEADVLSAPPA
jgi:hypothetical protein